MMLEAFRMILAQGFELAKHREKRAHDRFDGLVRPMYERIQKVHEDYVAMFSSAFVAVRQDVPLADVVTRLNMSRMETRVVRHEFFRVVEAVNRNDALPMEVQSFVRAIGNYVAALETYSNGTPATVVLTYLTLLADQEADKDGSAKLVEARRNAEHMLKRAVDHLDKRLEAISASYVVLLAARYV